MVICSAISWAQDTESLLVKTDILPTVLHSYYFLTDSYSYVNHSATQHQGLFAGTGNNFILLGDRGRSVCSARSGMVWAGMAHGRAPSTSLAASLPIRQWIVFKLATVTIRHSCLDCRRTYSKKFTITIPLELHVQLQLFSYSSNQPLHHLQRQRFVQPVLQSGTLLVSTPVQLTLFDI